MKLPELTQVQFQSAAQSQEFDPLKLPDPNPQLQENLATIQRSFANLQQENKINAEALYSQPGKMTTGEVIGQMAELLPQAVGTISELQNVDVAIQMARADDQYYQMLKQGLIPQNGELLAMVQNEKDREKYLEGVAAKAQEISDSYDVPKGILNFSNHGRIALRRKVAGHMMQNVYPEWMTTQLEINDTEIQVDDENGNPVMVRINQKNLPDFQFKQIMSHLRTAFLGHETLADTNNDLIQKELSIGFKTDATLEQAYSRNTRANDGNIRMTAGINNMFAELKEGNFASIGELQVAAKTIYDKKGKLPLNNPTRFFDRLITDIGTAAANGAEFDVATLITKGIMEDGQTFMERAPAQARKLMTTYRDNRRKYLDNKRKADKTDLEFDSAQFTTDCLEKGGCTTADFIDRIDSLKIRAAELGVNPTEMVASLQRSMRLSSVEGEALSELDRQARIALETGTVSMEADYAKNPVIYAKYKDKFEAQVSRKESEPYKFHSKQIERLIKGANSKLVDPNGDLKYMGAGANDFYQQVYDDEYARLKSENDQKPQGQQLDDKAIAQKAEQYTTTMWKAHQQDDTHPYYIDPKHGTFPNYPQTDADKAAFVQRVNMETLANEGQTPQGIAKAIANTPMLIYNTPKASLNALNAFIRTGAVGEDVQYKRNILNKTAGTLVIPKPEMLILAAAVGYGHITAAQASQIQSPYINRNATAQARRQARRDRMQISGPLYTDPKKYGPVSQMPLRGQNAPTGLQGLTDVDYRELAYIVSGEADRNTDDEFAVAASALNRLAAGGYGDSLYAIARAKDQYEAVTKGTARYEDALYRKLSSPQGQRRIAEMLLMLDGRTDFKGQSELGNRDPDNDPMVSSRGNFYHYAGQTGRGAYTGTVNRNYRRFLR